jgi:hypothetical protein
VLSDLAIESPLPAGAEGPPGKGKDVMADWHTTLNAFFAAYENRFNQALADPPQDDIDGTTAAFAECFIEASPRGVTCGKNDEWLRDAIPQGNAHYRSLGTQSMRVAGLEITPLDDLHAAVKVHWDSRYVRRSDGQPVRIEFDVTYLVQRRADGPKIFAYLTGDEQQALQDHGLMPEPPAG